MDNLSRTLLNSLWAILSCASRVLLTNNRNEAFIRLSEDEEAIHWESRFEEDVRLRNNCEEHVNRTSYRERYSSDNELRLDFRSSKCSSCSNEFPGGIGEESTERVLDEVTQRETLRELRVMRELCLALQSQLSRTALVKDTATQTEDVQVSTDDVIMMQSISKHTSVPSRSDLSSKLQDSTSASSQGHDLFPNSVQPIKM